MQDEVRPGPSLDYETTSPLEEAEQVSVPIPGNEASSSSPTDKPTPLPKGALLAVIAVIISEGFSFTFLFPFVGFMIIDFGMVKDERDAGYYAGLLAGVYSVAQFFSGFVFGILADRTSKRLVVVTSTVGGLIAITLLGLSPNYYWALAFRGFNGALNGNMSTTKAYLADITDSSNQSLAFSFIGVAWGIGAIGGPAIGGFLSNPATKYPSVFGGIALFKKHPYLLPCLFTASVQMMSVCCSALFMKTIKKRDEEIVQSDVEITDVELQESTDVFDEQSTPSKEMDVTLQIEQLDQVIEPTKSTARSGIISRVKNEVKEIIAIYRNTDVAICTFLYFTIAFLDTFQEESFPLWSLIDQKKGGLSFRTTQIGIVQMATGALMLVEPLIYPRVTKHLGKLGACRVGFCIYAMLVFTPLLSMLARISQVALGFGLALYSVTRASTEMFAFTSIFIMLNNSSPVGAAGRVQSLSHSVGCISRAAAPFLAGPIMAYCSRLASDVSGIFMHAPFFLLTMICAGALLMTMKLTKAINDPKTTKVMN